MNAGYLRFAGRGAKLHYLSQLPKGANLLLNFSSPNQKFKCLGKVRCVQGTYVVGF